MAEIDYPAILEEAWAQHLAPRCENAPTMISLFAGCGGSSLGYSMGGFRELLAVEWDNNAVETFQLNFPDVPVYHGDIANLSVSECLRLADVAPGQLDVLDGSPPCQGFSAAGKRVLDDDRNQLFREYVRLLRGLRPKVFVMENVSGLVKGKMKLVFAEIMRELKASGYRVSCRLLNAMYFHVPQSRQRLIFVGVRDDLGVEPSHPKAESRLISVRVAWQGIPPLNHEWVKVMETTKAYKALLQTPQGERIRGFSISSRLHFDKCAKTLQTGGMATGYPGSSWFSHPIEARGISVREAARLGSFPDSLKFIGIKQSCKQIGNSVPPLMMRAIARHIHSEILDNEREHLGAVANRY
jgi:DNA (cytosine-5)-methyltransferase 1